MNFHWTFENVAFTSNVWECGFYSPFQDFGEFSVVPKGVARSPWWVPGWSPGRHSISLHLKAADCEKIDILNVFLLSEFSNTMTTFMATFTATFMATFTATLFVATNFLISLFLFFPLYDFNLILLASQRASQTHRPPGYAPGTQSNIEHSEYQSVVKNLTFPCSYICHLYCSCSTVQLFLPVFCLFHTWKTSLNW